VKSIPKVGTAGRASFVVGKEQSIDIAGDAALAVLSTPALIWFLEHAARDALADLLEEEETSVGTQVDMEHLAATPLGQRVECVARIVHVDRSLITFQISATDQYEPIARGVHKRRVISTRRFQTHVARKRPA